MFDSLKITTSYLSFYCFWFFKPFSINEVRFLRTEPHSHLSMLMCKEFSRIVCVSLFSYQGCLSCDSFAILTCCFSFVKNFFKFFQTFSTPVLFNSFSSLSQLFRFVKNFFHFLFSRKNGEGGIWTLAPLLTTYSLSRGAPSASLGTSPNCPRFAIP